MKRLSLVLSLYCVSLGAATALELDMHGSMAQGYVLTEGNRAFGSSHDGSRDLYEVAMNGRAALSPKLLFSGQLMARRAGAVDDGKLRVDYAQLDYQFLSSLRGDAGVRLGKLKNPFGFYNDSRDIVFGRPGITMPNSVYFESAGVRDLFFSSEGVQLYGRSLQASGLTELTVGAARDKDVTEDFAEGDTMDSEVEIQNLRLAQLLQEWQNGRWRLGLSYFGANLVQKPNDPAVPGIRLGADLWVLSGQFQGEYGSLTGEAVFSDIKIESPFGRQESRSDGLYLQYRHIQSPSLEWYLRYDLSFSDRNDRDGRDYAARTGQPRHTQFSRDHVAGLQWNLTPHWSVFAEHHYTDGTSSVSRRENEGRELDRYWQMSLLMLAYRF